MLVLFLALYGGMAGSALLSMLPVSERRHKALLLTELLLYFFGLPYALSQPNILNALGVAENIFNRWMVINFSCVCLLTIWLFGHAKDFALLLAGEKRPAWPFRAALKPFLRGFSRNTLVVILALSALTLWLMPQEFLVFVLQDPVCWLRHTIGYALLSALPQEFAYRFFFCDRYRRLFPTPKAMRLASAVCFMFAHVIFRNYTSLAITFVAGWLFCRSYQQYGSLLFTALEHAIWGELTFTIGFWRIFAPR